MCSVWLLFLGLLPLSPICVLFDFCLKVYYHLLLYVFCLTSVWRLIATCSYMCSVWLLFEGLLPLSPICVLFDFCLKVYYHLLLYVFCLKVDYHLLLYVFCLTSIWRFITTFSCMCSVWLLFEGLFGGNKPSNRSQTEHIQEKVVINLQTEVKQNTYRSRW
jgi:hypothetical protein